jgi:predicted DNA-binding mobile mystery protein A
MRPEDRATARRQLDKRLINIKDIDTHRPPRGWIKAIREALGLTTAQLGRKLGVSQPRIVKIEKSEANGSITLDSLERAAQALDCRVVYALVPRESLENIIEKRAHQKAKKRLESTSHTMALEAQRPEPDDENEQLKRLANNLIQKGGSSLWEDE